MRPLPSISLIKTKLLSPSRSLSLSLSLYLLLFLSRFSPFSKSEKNDVSLSVHSKLHRSSLGFISAVQRLGAGRWDTLNGLRTS